MRCLLIFASCCALFAQENAPIGIVRGDLVKWEGTNGAGELEVRTADTRLLTCTFDGKTYFERDNERLAPGAMIAGDRLEIVSDRRAGLPQICYARTVHVIDMIALKRTSALHQRLREAPSPTELFAPRGDLTYAGIVSHIGSGAIVLKTRGDGDKTILVRSDTRYLGEGQRVGPEMLPLRTRVFIRAGKNLDGEIEAYQIVWGDIIHP
jgi:hypothetical protein